MKIRPSVFWLCAVGIVLVALIVWFGRKKPTEAPLAVLTQTNTVPSVATIPTPPVATAIHTNTPTANPTANTSQTLTPTKVERAIGILSTYNDVPIEFYGKVEDQYSNAVASANVHFSVRIINGYETTVTNGQAVSDANGFFTITGYHGQDLAVVPQKAGYVSTMASTLFKYSRMEDHPFVSDPNSPTVINMWKLQGAEPLVSINKIFNLPFAGEPIFFDFAKGNVVPTGGDLKVIITRAPGSITQRHHGDWSIQLVPVNGGIIETDYHTAQVTFEAPADGYQDSYFVQMDHDKSLWSDNIQKVFFLTSQNGQVYSKFLLNFGINDDPNDTMWFQFKGVANTNNSRNWEATVPQ
jgi:hypothetical protein